MRILLNSETSSTGGGGGGSTSSNEARIQLVIEAPDKKNFDGITAAGTALAALETQLKRVNETMQTLGLKKFPDIGKTVTDQTKGIADTAAGIAKLTSSLEELGKVKTKITKGGELLGGTVETKPFSTGTFQINDKGQAEEVKTKQDLLAQRKAWSKNLSDQFKVEEQEQKSSDERWKAHAEETLREQSEFKRRRDAINRQNDFPVTDADAALRRQQKIESEAQKQRDDYTKWWEQQIVKQDAIKKRSADADARTDQRVVRDGVKAQKEQQKSESDANKNAAALWRIRQASRRSQADQDVRDAEASRLRQEKAAKWEERRGGTELRQDLFTSSTQFSSDISGLSRSSTPHQDRIQEARARASKAQREADAYERASHRAHAAGRTEDAEKLALKHAKALETVAQANRHAANETARLNEHQRYIGKNMLQNVAHVTAWSAAVGTLYGSLRVLKESVGTMIELQYQQARLSVVMGLSQSETNGLTDDILRLAAANGRSGDDAMRAATQWARLGMTKRQVAEATRVSMVAANVAELTAAEATESLSSIMVTYNLRAEQLNGVLGMLNQTSNTYNVTVGELLNGLERVSVVSKQAGLSLAETQGIIGAAAGATGQTGANIGNALKSFIGAVSGEEGQKTLRSFGIEPTAGGELKDMTQIINDMYVAYQRMSAAEQRTMIFSAVGKNQASRVTAMLDNYVKSQVLAVNSLQNLNSAGAENEVILSTMKAQLQGVITEWMRFVSLQGKNLGKIGTFGGAVEENQASGLMKAVSNIGKLANTSGGSLATTAALGVLTATLMRMGVASYTASRGSAEWSQRGGVMKETARAVSSSINDLRMTLIRAAIPAANMTTAMNNMSVAGRRVAMVVGGLRLAGIGILQMAGGMAAATIVFGAFNKVVEELMKLTGNDTDQISERGDALADMANTAGRAAESYATAARLFQTSADAIANSANPKGTMSSILSQVSGLDDAIPGVEQRLKAASGSVVEFTRVLNDLKLESKGKQWLEQADSINKMNASIAIYKAKLESLRAGEGVMTAGGRQKDIAEMENKIKQAQDERFKTVQANQARMKEEVKEQFEQSVSGAAFLERQKILVSEISDLYKELGANSDHSTQQTLEIMRLDTMTGLYREQIGLLTARKKAAQDKLSEAFRADDPTVAIQGKVKLINEQIDDAKARLLEEVQESSNRGVSRSGGGYYRAADGSLRNRADDIREEINRLQNQRQKLTKSITERQNNDTLRQQINADAQAITNLNKSLQEAEARRKALNDQEERALRLAESRFRIQTYSSLEKTAIEASATGEDEFDKWESRQNYLRSRLDAFSSEDATQGQRLQALAQANELMNSGADALTKQAELEGKAKQHAIDRTKEYRKQLMMMGPGELLRDLAIRKMAPNMTGGQLLAMSPDARRQYEAMTGHDAQSREMSDAIAKFKALGITPESAIREKKDIIRRTRDAILPGMDSGIRDALKGTAVEVVAGLEVKTMNVTAGNVNLNAGGGGVPGRASGGPVEKGKTYIVGEKGPELVKMGGAGTVIPNNKIAGSKMPVSWEKLNYMRQIGLGNSMSKFPNSFEEISDYAGKSRGAALKNRGFGSESFGAIGKWLGRFAGAYAFVKAANRSMEGEEGVSVRQLLSGGISAAFMFGKGAAMLSNPFVMAAGLTQSGAEWAEEEMQQNRMQHKHYSDILNSGQSISDYYKYGIKGEVPPSQSAANAFGINEPNIGPLAKNPVSDFKLQEIEPKTNSDTRPEGEAGIAITRGIERYSIPSRRNQKNNRNIQPIYRPPPGKPAAAPVKPVAKPVAFDNPSSSGQGQGGGSFPAVMAAASAAVGAFSGAISAATANVSMFSQALTQAMANLTPKTAFASPPMNADNPFA